MWFATSQMTFNPKNCCMHVGMAMISDRLDQIQGFDRLGGVRRSTTIRFGPDKLKPTDVLDKRLLRILLKLRPKAVEGQLIQKIEKGLDRLDCRFSKET